MSENSSAFRKATDEAVARIGSLLTRRSHTLSAAESVTGGLVSDAIVSVPGASAFFRGCIVAYSDAAKESLLGVSRETLAVHGAVSSETALEMARGAARVFRSTVALSTTGIAGPAGQTKHKRTGLAYIAVVYADREAVSERIYEGNREKVRRSCALEALRLCTEMAERGLASSD